MSAFSWTAESLAAATGGTVAAAGSGRSWTHVDTDTRRIGAGSVFVALQGERFDGHDFVLDAVGSGASCVVVENQRASESIQSAGPDCAVVAVPDTLVALGDLAAVRRQAWTGELVGLTGSAGKTTTRCLVSAALGQSGSVHSTSGNWNNRIGLPLTLFGLQDEHDYAVLELGTSEPGEIAELARIADAQVGLITNIAPAHLAGFGSLAGVAAEKSALFESLEATDTAVVNIDDDHVRAAGEPCRAGQVTFGTSPLADVRVVRTRPAGPGRTEVALEVAGVAHQTTVEGMGEHMGINVAGAMGCAMALNLDVDSALAGMAEVALPARRMAYREVGGLHLIDDCYNSNPGSAAAALNTLARRAGSARRVAILGDMLELGPSAAGFHAELGALAAASGVGFLVAVGEHAQDILSGARSGVWEGRGFAAADSGEAIGLLKGTLKQNDWVLVKGSRGIALERVVDAIVGGEGIA
jgi:UDP-N-acetylmuramoyl-tripeptide--D-alanyl-D-alanine ligase